MALSGLLINFIGSLLLVFFTSPGLDVTATGDGRLGLVNSPTPEQRARNRRKYRLHASGFRLGVILLSIGFLLQGLAEVQKYCS